MGLGLYNVNRDKGIVEPTPYIWSRETDNMRARNYTIHVVTDNEIAILKKANFSLTGGSKRSDGEATGRYSYFTLLNYGLVSRN